MLALALLSVMLQQEPLELPMDTLPFDSPGTGALVERVIRAGAAVPRELTDYRADFRSAVYLSLATDGEEGGEVPVAVDEFAGEIRWARNGVIRQEIRGHRVRLLAPTPYTFGTLLESPWIVPHLYGHTIDVFQLAPTAPGRGRVSRAIHPFSPRGPDLYRYAVGDTVRVRTPEGVLTLVALEVRPRAAPDPGRLVVAGTFYIDLDRAAVARARFGFAEPAGALRLSRTGVFFELENGLVEGRFWLPYRQRQEIQVTSPLFGGAAAIRIATQLRGFDTNTGWIPPPGANAVLARDTVRGESAFRTWRDPIAEGLGEFDVADFDDLRRATLEAGPERTGPAVSFLPRTTDHLFRYNRVEGVYLGGAARVELPRARGRTEIYGTAGWAFAEGTARGEITGRRVDERATAPGAPRARTLELSAYRRLQDMQAFRPLLRWGLGQTLAAGFGGYDLLNYYDAAGVSAGAGIRNGALSVQLTALGERHRPVERNTERTFFGSAERFGPVAPADAGTHLGVEGVLRYSRGAGAFGVTSSTIASVRGEAGFGDWGFGRITALLSARRSVGPLLTLATRLDGGAIAGSPPVQYLLQVGEAEGLEGFGPAEFAGTVAAIGRGRILLHLPPYGNAPLARFGYFIIPPLKPALVGFGTAAWSDAGEESREALLRLGARTTEGVRSSVGAGFSIFEDAFVVEWARPLEGGEGRWYVGLVRWF